MSWLHTYGAKIDCKDLKVSLGDEKSEELYFYKPKKEKPYPLIFTMSKEAIMSRIY